MHTIRLRAAWYSTGRVHIRRFNRPTGLGGGEMVWIAVDGAERIESAFLNGEPIALGGSAIRYEVTLLLRPSNELVLVVDATEALSLLTTVRIEIESNNRLRVLPTPDCQPPTDFP